VDGRYLFDKNPIKCQKLKLTPTKNNATIATNIKTVQKIKEGGDYD